MSQSHRPQLDADGLRTPPQSVEAEQSVLGALLLDNAAWDRIADLLFEQDFYRYDHRVIFRHIVQMINSHRPADVITVFEALQSSDKHEEVGGLAYLNALAQNTPSAANIRHYAELVRERGLMRRLLGVTEEIAADVYAPAGRRAREILDAAEAKVLAVAEEGQRVSQTFQDVSTVMVKVIERIDELSNREVQSVVTGQATGFKDLDNATTGLQNGDLIIVAGRPSMGKTSKVMNMAEHVAIVERKPVAVFSMEMSADQLTQRLMGSVGRIDQTRLRTGTMKDEEWPRLTLAVQKIHEAPLFIDDAGALTVMEVRARARRLARVHGKLGMIVIDYLQLMSAGGEGAAENRANEVAEISRNLKALAKELDCPVVALSQLNRSLENRANKRPIMSDLRESGGLEQDADLILFIYRDEVYNPDSPDRGTAEIIIGKQRNGPLATIREVFNGSFTRFEDYAGSKLSF